MANEIISDALTRLQPKFRSLLAARIIKLTLNADSSRLNIAAALKILGANETIAAQTFTPRSATKTDLLTGQISTTTEINYQNGIPQIPANTAVQFQVQNNEVEDLYITVLVINPEGVIDIIFPNSWSAAENATIVKANSTLEIPKASDLWQITVKEPFGLSEVLVVASKSPLRKSLQSLQVIARNQSRGDLPVSVGEKSTEIIDLLLDDINSSNTEELSRNNFSTSSTTSREKVRLSDTTQIAAMSITYEAVG
ncbi:MAG: DUF4384 domain-containing protein, partial [Cyanobacteria bacterium J06600_6]